MVLDVFRTSEDGTPSVTFPGNFDRIVGLMGRNDLEDRSPERNSKAAKSDRTTSRNRGHGREEAGNEGMAKGRGDGRGGEEHMRPWTKYLLEEGLDRTEAFSRYRGMFAGEAYRFSNHARQRRRGKTLCFRYQSASFAPCAKHRVYATRNKHHTWSTYKVIGGCPSCVSLDTTANPLIALPPPCMSSQMNRRGKTASCGGWPR